MNNSDGPRWVTGGQYAPSALGRANKVAPIVNPRQTAIGMRQQGMWANNNQEAAASLKSMLGDPGESRKRKPMDAEEEKNAEPEDEVKLWENGWKEMNNSDGPRWMTGGQYVPSALGRANQVAPIVNPRQTAINVSTSVWRVIIWKLLRP